VEIEALWVMPSYEAASAVLKGIVLEIRKDSSRLEQRNKRIEKLEKDT
jgi:hypothetical protein